MQRIRLYIVRYASRAALAAMFSVVFVGCRSAPAPRERLLEQFSAEITGLELALERQDRPSPGVLRFALAFGARADLDLFVTGPLYESVYFANSPSAIGGELEVDLRCDTPAPRIEIITYPQPPPGVYRVGIDFPERCDEEAEAVPFAVSLQRDTAAPLATRRGIIRPGEFLTIVLETRIP